MHVSALLKRKGRDVVTVRPDDTAAAAAGVLAQHRIGAVLVSDGDGMPAGILSERDIVRHVAADGAAVLAKPVSALMTSDLVTIGPDTTDAEALALMSERRVRHLPVIDDGKLVGLISIGDVVKARLDGAELEVESLRGYVAGIG
ncbi:CBS domain-containing protein [Azospirillum halopraeferens]|uniref:CBS domain-containing protein n=1 Tax=Azospirillum halopraeferens TaxID=34010 RepID=UPI00041E16C1|nr:CBS domain-containing protein [Azospirillum halopraeferens]